MVKITIQKCMIWLPNETAVLKSQMIIQQ